MEYDSIYLNTCIHVCTCMFEDNWILQPYQRNLEKLPAKYAQNAKFFNSSEKLSKMLL